MRSLFAAALVLVASSIAAAGPGADTTDDWAGWSRERVRGLVERGQYEEAIEEYRALAVLRPSDLGPLADAAVLAVEAEHVRDKAFVPRGIFFRIAEDSVRLASARGGIIDPRLAYVVGRLSYADGKWGAAWRALRQACETGFDPVRSRFWYYRAAVNRAAQVVKTSERRIPDTIVELQYLDRTQPDHSNRESLRINLAAAHRAIQEGGEGKKILAEVLRENPRSAQAVYLLGMILRDEGDLEAALVRFREARAFSGANYDDATWGDSLLRESDVLAKLGRLDEAKAAADLYLQVKKDDPEGLFALGRVAYARGTPEHLEIAARLFRRVARLLPNTLDTLTNLLQVLHQLGQDEEAEQVQQRIQNLRAARDRELDGK